MIIPVRLTIKKLPILQYAAKWRPKRKRPTQGGSTIWRRMTQDYGCPFAESGLYRHVHFLPFYIDAGPSDKLHDFSEIFENSS